ncbi:hypothetical protein [Paenibacillus sp. FSL H8-0260]|uniref:hypothetical protein n=1 Tax=Paenibacillus sp. FSL H8-0260 TaxID=2921380 RepID=UPI0032549642
MSIEDYKNNDDLQLYDSVIKKLIVDHENKSIEIHFLKVVERVDRGEHNFTYKVREAILTFSGVVYANLPYCMEFDEWSEFYRSAIVKSSRMLERVPERAKSNKLLQHIYLGIDNGNEYNQQDIVCSSYSMELGPNEYILHDDFEWLYEE